MRVKRSIVSLGRLRRNVRSLTFGCFAAVLHLFLQFQDICGMFGTHFSLCQKKHVRESVGHPGIHIPYPQPMEGESRSAVSLYAGLSADGARIAYGTNIAWLTL
jgi:hypothetical protein